MAGTDLFSASALPNVKLALIDNNATANGYGLAYFARCTGVPPTNANYFQTGCIMVRTDGASGNVIYINNGTPTVPVWSSTADNETYNISLATVNTTGSITAYAIAPANGQLSAVQFTDGSNLAASASNYISFLITNLGQNATGTTAMLNAAITQNTTKVTGLTTGLTRALVLSPTTANVTVSQGDVLQVQLSTNGTLANTVLLPVFLLSYI